MINKDYRSKGACDIERFKSTVVIESEKAEEKLMSSWYPKVITLFSDPKLLPKLSKDRMDSFFECSSTLIGNQVDMTIFAAILPALLQIKRLLTTSIKAYEELFDRSNVLNLPLFKLQLCVDDNKMLFFPYLEDMEEAVMFVVNTIAKSMQSIPTVQV